MLDISGTVFVYEAGLHYIVVLETRDIFYISFMLRHCYDVRRTAAMLL